MKHDERIDREREALALAPWELAPSEVDDGPCPWPPGSVGAASWAKALELKKSLAAAKAGRDTTPARKRTPATTKVKGKTK
jgi:hypothetical protein